MNPIRTGQNREVWNVTNVSGKVITISDLSSVPAIDPNKTVNLLYFETKDKISTSTVIPTLIARGWITMTKIGVDGSVVVNAGNVQDALQPAQKEMVYANEGSGSGGSTTVNVGPIGTPLYTYVLTPSVAAGGTVTMSSTAITVGQYGNLNGFIVTSNSAFKAYCVMVNGDVESSPIAYQYSLHESWNYTPPGFTYFRVYGGASGFCGFRMYITNLDPADTSDMCVVFYYSESST